MNTPSYAPSDRQTTSGLQDLLPAEQLLEQQPLDIVLDRETWTEDPLKTAFSIAVGLGNQHQIRVFLQFFGYTT